MTIAVLALQGAFIEHEQMLQKLGVHTIELRQASDLQKDFDGIILPGGESTVQSYIFYFISICKQFCEITLQFSISGSKLRITGVDRNENTFIISAAFKDQLMICNDNISVRTIAKSITVSANFNQF